MGCDDLSVAAQAAEFIRALRVQTAPDDRPADLDRTPGCHRQEQPGDPVGSGCAARDIQEAQILIDRLQRRYLYGDERKQQRPPGRQPRPM